jgi:plasmid stabilization system protein ParE
MVSFHEAASFEMNEAAKYYEDRATGLGLVFLTQVEESIDQVLANPESCQCEHGEIRRKRLRRFPYSLFYAIETDRIRVLAVAHQKRRPGYWQERHLRVY